MEDIATAVISLLERERISQRALAARAGISQATVSRVIHGRPLERGRARTRLLAYLLTQGALDKSEPIFTAVREIWDGSEAHAAALAHLIRASGELWPKLQRSDE